MSIFEVWWHIGSPSIECSWAGAVAEVGSLSPQRFGASDCGCPGHLIIVAEKRLLDSAWTVSKEITSAAISRVEMGLV
jgi:Uri superfamily endonuclease